MPPSLSSSSSFHSCFISSWEKMSQIAATNVSPLQELFGRRLEISAGGGGLESQALPTGGRPLEKFDSEPSSAKHPAIWLIFLLLAMLAGCGAQAQPRSIFLLAGQSNMSGRGGVRLTNETTNTYTWDGVVPPKCQPNPAIFRFSRNQAWEEAREALHKDIDSPYAVGVGPGMPFANTILQLKPSLETIGLVPCAIGASSLHKWEKGGIHYASLINRARSSTIGGGVIKAMLWYQGETDSLNESEAKTYGERFEKFINEVRTDLFFPTLPVIQVALDRTSNFSSTVRKAQLGVRLPNVRCVDALGLPLEPDQVHLTTPSQVLLGEKIALDYLIHF